MKSKPHPLFQNSDRPPMKKNYMGKGSGVHRGVEKMLNLNILIPRPALFNYISGSDGNVPQPS